MTIYYYYACTYMFYQIFFLFQIIFRENVIKETKIPTGHNIDGSDAKMYSTRRVSE